MLSLATPLALLLLPLPWLIKRVLPREKQTEKPALILPFFDSLQQQRLQKEHHRKHDFLLLFLLWSALIIALSGPIWIGDKQVIHEEGRNILLALDVSGSMEINDMRLSGKQVDRLSVVKQTALDFVKARDGDRVGLILFGTHAYLQTPLTFDLKTVSHMIKDASIGLAGQTTSIGDAIGLAIKKLSLVPGENKVLVLLTDGSNNSGVLNPLQAAQIAKDKHIKIYTIGLGSTQMIVQNIFGLQAVNPSQDLDEATLEAIAKETGGVFFRAKDTEALSSIYETINTLEPNKGEGSIFRPIKDYYVYPLSLAFLLYCWLLMPKSFVPLRRLFIKGASA